MTSDGRRLAPLQTCLRPPSPGLPTIAASPRDASLASSPEQASHLPMPTLVASPSADGSVFPWPPAAPSAPADDPPSQLADQPPSSAPSAAAEPPVAASPSSEVPPTLAASPDALPAADVPPVYASPSEEESGFSLAASPSEETAGFPLAASPSEEEPGFSLAASPSEEEPGFSLAASPSEEPGFSPAASPSEETSGFSLSASPSEETPGFMLAASPQTTLVYPCENVSTSPRTGSFVSDARPARPKRRTMQKDDNSSSFSLWPYDRYRETLDAQSRDMGDGSRQLNQYRIYEVIGQGAYGTVHRATLADDPSVEFAVKEFSKTRLRRNQRAALLQRRPGRLSGTPPVSPAMNAQRVQGSGQSLEEARRERSRLLQSEEELSRKDPLHLIRRELAILKKLHHTNVVRLFEVLNEPGGDSLFMVFEYCPGGRVIEVDVDHAVTPLPEERARLYMRQVMLGVEYLHSNKIAHRDLKPENILLTRDRQVCKIVDFGVSEMFVRGKSDTLFHGAGSPAFMSPELVEVTTATANGERRAFHGYQDDLWSMGVTFYCMAVGALPFNHASLLDLYHSISHDEPSYPSTLPEGCKRMLQSLLRKTGAERATLDELRSDPWLTRNGQDPFPPKEANLATMVQDLTEEDIQNSIVSVTGVFTVVHAVTKFRRALSRNTSASTLRSRSKDLSLSEDDASASVPAPTRSFSRTSTSTSNPPFVASPLSGAMRDVPPVPPIPGRSLSMASAAGAPASPPLPQPQVEAAGTSTASTPSGPREPDATSPVASPSAAPNAPPALTGPNASSAPPKHEPAAPAGSRTTPAAEAHDPPVPRKTSPAQSTAPPPAQLQADEAGCKMSGGWSFAIFR